MLPTVNRLRPSWSFGASSVMSFSVAFDPGLNLRGQEARGDPDDQKQHKDHDDGGDGGACDFQCFHGDIPGRASGIEFKGEGRAEAYPVSLSGNRQWLKRCQK
jgi:hypothetical protein